MRNKRNRVIIIILTVLFCISTAGEILFLYMGMPLSDKYLSASYETADFSFLTEKSSFSPVKMKGMNVDLSVDFDATQNETQIKSQIATAIYDASGFECNTIIITNAESDIKSFDAVEYLITSAESLDMSIGFAVDSVADGKINLNGIKGLYTKYQPDFFVINDYDEICENQDDIVDGLCEIRSYIDSLSNFCKVGYIADFDISDSNILPVCLSDYSDFIIIDCDVTTEHTGFESRIKTFGNLYMQYGIPVILNIHNELTLSGGEWNNADEVYEQLKAALYNGMCGVVINSCDCVVKDYKGTAVSIYSFFKMYNDVDYTALDVTSFNIKDNVLSIGGKAKGDYPVFINNDITGELQQKTVDEGLTFNFNVKLDYGVNTVTIIHKNATYSYRLCVAEDLIEDISYSSEKKVVHIECSSLEGANVYCCLFGEYKQMEKIGEENGRVKYGCDFKTLLPKTLSESDISIGAECNGLFDCIINGERENSVYRDNGLGRCDCVVVSNDYTETTPASESTDLSVPTYSYQLKNEIGYVDKIGVYENTVLYKLKNGIQLSSENADYIINGYIMPDNNCSVTADYNETETTINFKFDYLPFTRVILAPQNYYVGYMQREYNVDSCEAEYVDIEFKNVAGINGEFNCLNDGLFKGYDRLSDADGTEIILRLYLRSKGCFYGYSIEENEKNTLTFKFKHKKELSNATVIIDAGHGGSGEVGTYSFDGKVYEKSVTLSIAQKVMSYLEGQGINVSLSRTADYNLNINVRQMIARYKNPDCFVSIHCDGSTDTSAYGTHTFYYNSYSRALADNINVNLVKAYQTGLYNDSTKPEYNGCALGVKFYPFGVTRITECPSVLVECGYLTNQNDELFMCSENGQNLIAKAIGDGIIGSLK